MVRFKSTPSNYAKEKSGVKRNTVREIDENDIRFKILREGMQDWIVIENTETGETFQRFISDYTEWRGLAIISWRDD